MLESICACIIGAAVSLARTVYIMQLAGFISMFSPYQPSLVCGSVYIVTWSSRVTFYKTGICEQFASLIYRLLM
jgi:hypothetical protein